MFIAINKQTLLNDGKPFIKVFSMLQKLSYNQNTSWNQYGFTNIESWKKFGIAVPNLRKFSESTHSGLALPGHN